MLINNPKFKAEAISLLKQLNSQILKQPPGEQVDVNPSILYLKTLIDVLTVSCEGKNSSTESKSQSYFPLREMLSFYSDSSNLFFFKESIVNFIYHVYLDIERVDLEGYGQIGEAMLFLSCLR